MKITDNVYLLESSRGSHCYIIQAEETVLIDTGLPMRGKKILREIKYLNINLKHILLTHHDIGHIGNVAMLENQTGAQVWAPEQDIPYIQGDKDCRGFRKYLKYILRGPKPKSIKPLPTKISGIQVIPTPGHTPGHVCFIYKDILFVGDLLKNKRGILRPSSYKRNWDNELMMQSVQTIADHPFRWICPAHGNPIDFSPPQQIEPGFLINRKKAF